MSRKKQLVQHQIVRVFAARLREARRATGMSQQDLGFKAQVNVAYIGKLERAESAPGLDLIARLAEALGVSAVDLIGDTPTTQHLNIIREQARKHVERLINRGDAPAIQAVAVLVGLADSALARRNS